MGKMPKLCQMHSFHGFLQRKKRKKKSKEISLAHAEGAREVMLGTVQWYHGMENSYHIPLISTPCYHTIPCYCIPYQMTSYHTKAFTGCLGSFFKIYKLFLQAAILVHWVPFSVAMFFMFFLRY